MTDLYDELGIDRAASADDIKAAWRKRAQQAHPDKGGSEKKFHQIQRAYETLSDPHARKHYDDTGQTADAMNALEQQIAAMVVAFVDGAGDVSVQDVVKAMRIAIRDAIKQSKIRAVQMERVLAKRRAALARLKHKGKGRNILEEAILKSITTQEHQIARQGEEGKQGEAMLKVLADYDYKTDAAPADTIGDAMSDHHLRMFNSIFGRGPYT